MTLSENNVQQLSNEVDGALILTVGGVDSVLWESKGRVILRSSLYDGVTTLDSINILSTPDTVQTVPNNNKVEVRYGLGLIDSNASIMSKLTLQVNETVSLKFKTKTLGDISVLTKAQFFLQELDM